LYTGLKHQTANFIICLRYNKMKKVYKNINASDEIMEVNEKTIWPTKEVPFLSVV
jgi:hypothetical protein